MNDRQCQSLDRADSHWLSRPSDLASRNAGLEWCDKLEMDCARMVNQYSYAAIAVTDREVRRLVGDAVQCFQARLESARRLRRQLEQHVPIDGPILAAPEAPPSVDPGAGTEDPGGRHD